MMIRVNMRVVKIMVKYGFSRLGVIVEDLGWGE